MMIRSIPWLGAILGLGVLGVMAQPAWAESPNPRDLLEGGRSMEGGGVRGREAGEALPVSLTLEDPEEHPDLPEGASSELLPDSPFIDLGGIQLEGRVSLLDFSSNFHSTVKVGGGILARAPLAWFSHELLGLAPDQIGAFTAVTVSSISRNLSGLPKSSGRLLFADLGLDFTFLRGEEFFGLAQVGARYGYFGGVTDLQNGVALLVGVMGGVRAYEKIWVTVNPEVAFGDAGSVVYALSLGVSVHF